METDVEIIGMVHDATTLKAMHVTPMQVDNGQGQVGA